MYYDETPSPSRRRARRRIGCLGRLVRLALVALILYALLMLVSGQLINFGLFAGGGQSLEANASLPSGYTNILLLGCDEEKGEGNQRADSIIVASVGNSGALKLTSIMRDTMLDMGEQGRHKLNAAYRLGGPELTMRTLNRAFGLNLTKYVTIDFQGFAKVIDSIGGIELTITEDEMKAINTGLRGAYKKKRVFNGVLMTPLTEFGKNIHLSGTHALFYARIREIDSDYMRAGRQRTVIDTVLKKLRRSKNPLMLASAGAAVLECTNTNLNPVEMGALAMRVLTDGGEMQQFRIPADGAYKQTMDGGIWQIVPDLSKNRKLLREFIYGS